MNLRKGAWGGGNQFGRALVDFLRDKGETVTFDLSDRDIDIILLTEPNRRLKTSAYDHMDILKYVLLRNRKALVVHRMNNTSEARSDADGRFNRFRVNANRAADYTVFISRWAHARYVESGFRSAHYRIILNGADRRVWKPREAAVAIGPAQSTNPPVCGDSSKIGLVTHHWSDNPNKGFDIYARLDNLLADPAWSHRAFFTYIGRLPRGFKFRNSRYIEPMDAKALADVIGEHDIYLTASRNESAGMHHIEGALCGLPILYRNSGAFDEYCRGFGLAFDGPDFEQKLNRMLGEMGIWKERIKDYPHTAERMCGNYYYLFQELIGRRDEILKRRRLTRWISMAIGR